MGCESSCDTGLEQDTREKPLRLETIVPEFVSRLRNVSWVRDGEAGYIKNSTPLPRYLAILKLFQNKTKQENI